MKKNLNFLVLMLFCKLFCSASVFTDSSMVVNNTSHKILFSIPDNYNSENEYPLVIGIHYCGGSAVEYRNALKIFADSLGVIVACPDYSSSQVPDADTNMFKILVDTANSIYNINTNEIFLTGMSCNGDFGLRQGLNKVYPFKGIFLWDPWVTSSSPVIYNYNSDMPVVLSIGTNDPNLISVLQVYDSLKNHQANVNIIFAPGVGHTLGFNKFGNVMVRSFDYINNKSELKIEPISDIAMTSAETKELTFNIDNTLNKEYDLNVYSSHPNKIPAPEITKTDNPEQYKIALMPNVAGGVIYFVVELIEKDGNKISQTAFKVTLEKVTEIKESGSQFKVKMYPNPVNDVLFLENIANNNTIEVFDVLGNKVQTYFANANNCSIPFNFPKGLYLIKISDTNNFETHIIAKNN